MQRGFVRKTFVDAAGDSHHYVIFVPHNYVRGSKPPVLMFLNGLGENGEDGFKQISNNFGVQIWESREFFPFIAIAPQCRTMGTWSPDSLDTQWALQILDESIKEYDADADRVYLTGVSSGGGGVWNLAGAFAERFAAVAPLCGSGMADTQRLVEARLPIWNFYNDGDANALVEGNRRTRAELIEGGTSPLFTEYSAEGHDCWNRTYRSSALLGWLLEQRRSKNANTPLFRHLPAGKLLQEWRTSSTNDWKTDSEGRLVGKAGDPKQSSLLIPGSGSDACELHGDVWLLPNSSCRIACVSDSDPAHPIWITLMVPELGIGQISGGSLAVAQPLNPTAQRVLRENAWNDVRVRIAEGRLTLRLNGWPALEVEIAPQNGKTPPTQWRCGLVAPGDGSEIKWRYLRTRTSAVSPSSKSTAAK